MDESHYIIDRQRWIQAAIQTSERTLDFAKGQPLEAADEWYATNELRPDDHRDIQVSGPIATINLRCCTTPAHWPTHRKLSKIITEPRPRRRSWLRRKIHRLRLSLSEPADHDFCWLMTIVPNPGIRIAASPTTDP